jgi:hypothetical protein
MRRVWLVLGFALLLPAGAGAKLVGDLRMCGARECRTIDRHLRHDTSWPLLAAIATWPSSEAPAAPGPFYRLTIVPVDERGRPQPAGESEPFYFVPNARMTRSGDGGGGAVWSRVEQIPKALSDAMRALRPLPAPRLTRVVVGNRVANDPHSYLRLFRLPSPRRLVRDPAGPRPGVEPTTSELVAYWESVRRLYIPITLEARRDTPWSDHKTSLWIGRRHDLLMRDGELVRVPRLLADRVRRARSLR